MKTNQIIILILIIFLALVGYKFISANIQENKEKAVLQERHQLELLQKEEEHKEKQKETELLNSCLADAENVSARDSALIFILAQCWGVGTLNNGSQEQCVKNKGEGRKICQLQSGICTDVITDKINGIKDNLKKDRQECYTRYK